MLFFARNHFPTQNLLSDTEVLENISKNFIRGYLSAGNLCQLVKTDTQVLTDEVSAKAEIHTLNNALNALIGMGQCFVVPGIRYDNAILVNVGNVSCTIDGSL